MKKLLLKLTTLLLAVVIGTAGFSGCNLITDDTERNLNQVVATVNINRQENIYKKDLIVGYMNYGYIYTQYYGYDAARTYKLILNGLIENRIVVQVAAEKFENGDAELGIEQTVEQADIAAPAAERYLTDDEIIEAKYSAYLSINNLLDGYSEDKTNVETKDTLIFDVRTVPTDASNAEKDVDKEAYVNDIETNGFDVDGEYSRPAFNKIIKLLKENDLLGKDYDGTLLTTEYLKQLLKNNYESQLISNYEEAILKGIKTNLTYEKLEQSYTDKLNAQGEWSNKDFVDALSSASATSPILYSRYGTYGYVYNLLLGINDYQSEKIADLQEKRDDEHLTEAAYSAERKDILAGTIAKDLRSSWILSGYDFDFDTKKFTGDYTFAKDAANSLAFQGVVEKLRDADDDRNLSAVYKVDSTKTFGLEEFTKFVNNYVYEDENVGTAGTSDDIYWEYTTAALDKDKEYDAKINELLFAFSTDPGSLNTYKGYVIKPDNNEYVKTFGDAGKALLDAGGSSYKVVASDYGYHFMFFSEVWTVNKQYATLSDYLDTLNIDMDGAATWEEYFNAQKEKWEDFEEENNFLYFLANELISAKLSAKSSKSKTVLINTYRYDTKYTNVYESRYADLLG